MMGGQGLICMTFPILVQDKSCSVRDNEDITLVWANRFSAERLIRSNWIVQRFLPHG